MSINQTNPYDIDRHVAELYDRIETRIDDLDLIRKLIGTQPSLRILEPFCGTGRLLIPLAMDGHITHGLDQSQAMLDIATQKRSDLPNSTQTRICLEIMDVISGSWPDGFDLVILGCNCFYELASPDEQQGCIRSAFRSLKPNGAVYIDNDHMEGDLSDSWRKMEMVKSPLSGICEDGTQVENWMETVWYDAPARLVRLRRILKLISPNGTLSESDCYQQKHPVSTGEVKLWLDKAGFTILKHMGDQNGHPYTAESRRSIFWARHP